MLQHKEMFKADHPVQKDKCADSDAKRLRTSNILCAHVLIRADTASLNLTCTQCQVQVKFGKENL